MKNSPARIPCVIGGERFYPRNAQIQVSVRNLVTIATVAISVVSVCAIMTVSNMYGSQEAIFVLAHSLVLF